MTQTVAEIAKSRPHSIKVFQKHSIDFCCGGKRPFEDVCKEKDINPVEFLLLIKEEELKANATLPDFDSMTLTEIVDHIEATYHRPLDEELPRLEMLARKVNYVHHDKAPEMLDTVMNTFIALKTDLIGHMEKEETVLFPEVRQAEWDSIEEGFLAIMDEDHTDAGQLLATLNTATNGHVPPAGACNSWRALWEGLSWLEKDLHTHIHIENNILFPKIKELME